MKMARKREPDRPPLRRGTLNRAGSVHTAYERHGAAGGYAGRASGTYPAKGKVSEIARRIKRICGSIVIPGESGKIEREEKKDEQGGSYFVTRIKERRFYLYTPTGDGDRLFQLVDRHSNIPLLPEFQKYLLDEAHRRGILIPLTVLSSTESFDAWKLALNENEQNLHEVLDDGLQIGKIKIPGADAHASDAFKDVETISQYLAKFGVTIAERIKDRYRPLFDPSKESFSPEVDRVNGHIFQNTGYHLYDAQLAAAEAASRKIDQSRPAIIVGDCGSGKTKIGMTALAASQMRETQKSISTSCCVPPIYAENGPVKTWKPCPTAGRPSCIISRSCKPFIRIISTVTRRYMPCSPRNMHGMDISVARLSAG